METKIKATNNQQAIQIGTFLINKIAELKQLSSLSEDYDILIYNNEFRLVFYIPYIYHKELMRKYIDFEEDIDSIDYNIYNFHSILFSF